MSTWETCDNYEKAGIVLNYIAALAALLSWGYLAKNGNVELSNKKLMGIFAFILILVTIGNTAFVVKTS
jgi:hypothetical protein